MTIKVAQKTFKFGLAFSSTHLKNKKNHLLNFPFQIAPALSKDML